MNKYTFIKLREHGELAEQTAEWFYSKWNIPKATYSESISECLKDKSAVPQWYVVLDGETIIAGLGVIENDFHNRKDLAPNVCAVYVEERYRKQAIAGKRLDLVCNDMNAQGIDVLYLLTDYTGFYERYGWNFLCMVQGNGEEQLSRMYMHQTKRS